MYRFYRFLSFRIFFLFCLCYSLTLTWIVRYKNFSMCRHVIPDDCGPSERVEPVANKSFCILYSVRSSCNSIPSYTATMYYKYRPVILPPTSYEGSTFVSLSKGISNIYLRPVLVLLLWGTAGVFLVLMATLRWNFHFESSVSGKSINKDW
jgi:hypothetical protein